MIPNWRTHWQEIPEGALHIARLERLLGAWGVSGNTAIRMSREAFGCQAGAKVGEFLLLAALFGGRKSAMRAARRMVR